MEGVYEHADRMKNQTQTDRSKAGFTLIEVIAVLVILGVLAAVAIPRYVSLIDDARDKALDGALAAGLSHVSLAYGQYALEHGVEPTAEQLRAAALAAPPRSEDYSFAFAVQGEGVRVTATELDKEPAKSAFKDWLMP